MILSGLLALAMGSSHLVNDDHRMQWWTDARFGMFIHWDMSSLAGTEISWSRKGSKPLDIFGDPAGVVEDPAYDHLYQRFNPSQFDAESWAKLAQDSGMKYVVFTAKHHGGFAMFDTALSNYGITHTAFKRDVLGELIGACRRHHLKVGIYYSQRDWHHPDYGVKDNAKYHAYLTGQLTELLTHYGKIDVMWFDSFGHGNSINYWKADQVLDLVKRLQPGIIVNNRTGSFAESVAALEGDFDTPEQRLGSFQNNRAWESCMTVVTVPDGGGWSYRSDGKVKPYEECVKALVSCATGDGNLLLDVGPDSTGIIPNDQAMRLREVGKWIAKYGKSIYKTRGGPYRNGSNGGSTYRDRSIFLHVFSWPKSGLRLAALKSKIQSIKVLTGGRATWHQTPDGIDLSLSEAYRDKLDTVIEIKLAGPAASEMPDHVPLPTF